MSASVHPTAVVHPSAHLDDGVRVGPYTVIGANVRIGAGTVLHNHVTVQQDTTIGRDNVLYPFCVLGAEPQDLKYRGGATSLVLGDRNRVREHATIHRGTELGGGVTRIGSDCLIMVGVHVAHDCTIEDEVVIANGSMLGGHCLVEFGAAMGGGAGVHHFSTVGTLSFIGGMSRITRDVPPYTVVEGVPAEPRKINTTALMRRKWDADEIERLREAFRLIFREPGMTAHGAIERLRSESGVPRSVARLCDFVEMSHLGVHGRRRESTRDPEAPRFSSHG